MGGTDSRFFMRSVIRILRGAVSTLLFALFSIGALIISPIVLLFPRPEWGQRIIRLSWQPFVFLFVVLGLVRVDRGNLKALRGAVLAANHPSLIDIVLLTVLLPHTLWVAKHALKRNLFVSILVRCTALPDDGRLIDAARQYLAKGWNVLVFPEGTRSPARGLHPFRRGAAQLAIRTAAPLVAIGITQSERVMGKGQRPWQAGARHVTYSFQMDGPEVAAVQEGETFAQTARRVTASLESRIRALAPSMVKDKVLGKRKALVIPVYNPEPGLVSLCQQLVGRFDCVVVVDDGSEKNCALFDALPSGITLLRHRNNRGKGSALKTAFEHLASDPSLLIVCADGDGQHRAEDIMAVARCAQEQDIVTFGVRDFNRKDIPFRSWWGNRWTAFEVWLVFGFDLKDTQTGLRAIPSRMVKDVAALRGERYEFESRIFRMLASRGEMIAQVPIETVYCNANRTSHFRPVLDTLRTQAALFA